MSDDIDLKDAEVLDLPVVIIFMVRTACGFNDAATRKKCRRFLNVILSFAEQRGYSQKQSFLDFLDEADMKSDSEMTIRLVNSLCNYISTRDVNTAFDYIGSDK